MHNKRRFLVASVIAVLMTAAFLPGSGLGSSVAVVRGAHANPAGLAAAIHARLGAGAIRSSSSAALAGPQPDLGFSVALSADGTTALVGAPGVAGGRGAAYIFHASDAGSWSSKGTPTAALTNKHGTAKALFGFSVGLSADGTTAVVGAPHNGTGFLAPGAIYVFHVSAEDAWASSSAPKATLKPSNGFVVGIALALAPDGTTLVAGAPGYDTGAGGAYVFHSSSEGAWASTSTPTATLSNTGESQADSGVGFAVTVSGDGTTALVSDSENPSGGGAYVYHASAEDAWTTKSTPTAILSDANSGSHDSLGLSLALSGDGTVALLGAPGASSSAGAVDVFHSSAEASWASSSTPTATLTNAVGSSGDRLGDGLAVSTDGTTALVSASGVSSKRGAAYVFRAPSEAAWAPSVAPAATLTDPSGHAKDALGAGVLSGDGATALVGAPGVRSQTGAADVFHVLNESLWASSSTPAATLTVKALAACVVPKLKGLKLAAAKSALEVGRCRLGKVTKVHSTKRGRGRVLSQNRKRGRRLAIGAKVGVRVGK